MKKLMFVLILLGILIVGCAPIPSTEDAVDTNGLFTLIRVVDVDAEVVCWVGPDAISCLPFEQVNNPTRLKKMEKLTTW